MATTYPALLNFIRGPDADASGEERASLYEFIWNGGASIYVHNQNLAQSTAIVAARILNGVTDWQKLLDTSEELKSGIQERKYCLIRLGEDLFLVKKEALIAHSKFFNTLLTTTHFQEISEQGEIEKIDILLRDIIPEATPTTPYSFWLFLLALEGVSLEKVLPQDDSLFSTLDELVQFSNFFDSLEVIKAIDGAFLRMASERGLTPNVIGEGLWIANKYDLKRFASQLLYSAVLHPSFNGATNSYILPLLARYGSYLVELPRWVTNSLSPLGFDRIYEYCPKLREISLEAQKLIQLDYLPETTTVLELHAPKDITVDALNVAFIQCSNLHSFRCYDIPANFTEVQYPPSLREVHFQGCSGMNDQALHHLLQQLPHLRTMTLIAVSCSFENIHLPQDLEVLRIQNVMQVSQIGHLLEDVENLQELDVRGTFILLSSQLLPKSLRRLYLSEAQVVTSEDIEAIYANCPELEALYCSLPTDEEGLRTKNIFYYSPPPAAQPDAEALLPAGF